MAGSFLLASMFGRSILEESEVSSGNANGAEVLIHVQYAKRESAVRQTPSIFCGKPQVL